MSGIILILFAVAVYLIAYKFYGTIIAKIFNIDSPNETPSHSMNNGVDYVPAKPPVLLNQNYSLAVISILLSGLAIMLGIKTYQILLNGQLPKDISISK